MSDHPGKHLVEALKTRNLTPFAFAKMHGLDPDQVDALVEGTKAVDTVWDVELSTALDTPIGHWLELQADHDAAKAPAV